MFPEVDKKLERARYFLENIITLAEAEGGIAHITTDKQQHFRANLDGFFFEIISAKDFFLQGINDKCRLDLPKDKQYIEAEGKFTEELIPSAMKLGEMVPGYDIRAMQQMVLMCKAKALMEGRDKVSASDVDRVLYLFDTYALKVPNLDAETKTKMSESYKKEQGVPE